MWQEIIVGICVVFAVVFLVRRWLVPTAKKSASCGGCGGCGTAKQCSNPEEKDLR